MPGAPMSPTPTVASSSAAASWRSILWPLAALVTGIGLGQWIDALSPRSIPAYLSVRTTFITAERPGRLIQVQASEGERITEGAPLVTLADSRIEKETGSIGELVDSLRMELQQAESKAAVELAMREQEIDTAICRAQLESAEFLKEKFDHELTRSMLADLLASRESAIWDNGDTLIKDILISQKVPNRDRMATALQMEQASNQADISAAQAEICERRVQSLQGLKAALPKQLRDSCGVAVIEMKLKQAQARLSELNSRSAELVVASPVNGQVGMFRKRAGDELQPGDPIVELLDDTKRYLVAEVPSQRITEFHAGRSVQLTFPGGEIREGRIVHVAPQANPRNPGQLAADPIVQVEIEQVGAFWPTNPIGSRIEVDLKNDHPFVWFN